MWKTFFFIILKSNIVASHIASYAITRKNRNSMTPWIIESRSRNLVGCGPTFEATASCCRDLLQRPLPCLHGILLVSLLILWILSRPGNGQPSFLSPMVPQRRFTLLTLPGRDLIAMTFEYF
jgi:hypothetical protein